MKKILLLILFLHSTILFSQYKHEYTTYLGGSDFEQARDLEIDLEGNIYLVGGTSSEDFPTTEGVYNRIYYKDSDPSVGNGGPMMVFVSKFSPTGELLWSTIIGGPNYDRAYAVEVDKDGYVYVGGRAGENFPTTSGALQEVFTQKTQKNNRYGHQNGFILKLSPDGSDLIWSSYYGSDSFAFFRDIAIDEDGFVYGILNGVLDEPIGILEDGFGPTHNGQFDMVAVKFSQEMDEVIWANFIGGSADDKGGPAIKVGSDRSVFVCGGTQSQDIATTSGAFQEEYGGGSGDLYVARIEPDGKELIYLSYLGGTGNEFSETHSLFVDQKNHAYVACGTNSKDLFTTPNAISSNLNGDNIDALLVKFSQDGSELEAATYFGGLAVDSPEGLYADSSGNFYVVGMSESDGLPTNDKSYIKDRSGNRDGFIVKVNPEFTEVEYCSYFGGSLDESNRAFDVGLNGSFAISGQTLSQDLEVSDNAFQDSYIGPSNKENSFLAIFNPDLPSSIIDQEEIKLFPNPSSNKINFPEDKIGQKIKVYNSLGMFIEQVELNINYLIIDDYLNGKYFIKFESGEVVSFLKI